MTSAEADTQTGADHDPDEDATPILDLLARYEWCRACGDAIITAGSPCGRPCIGPRSWAQAIDAADQLAAERQPYFDQPE